MPALKMKFKLSEISLFVMYVFYEIMLVNETLMFYVLKSLRIDERSIFLMFLRSLEDSSPSVLVLFDSQFFSIYFYVFILFIINLCI